MSKTIELKPCPFCGHAELLYVGLGGNEADPTRFPNCNARGPDEGAPVNDYDEELLSAEGAWNQRGAREHD